MAVVWVGAQAHAAPSELEQDLQPIPKKIFFENPEDFEPETFSEISDQIQESFADLNKVVLARERLVRRFGLVSVRRLEAALRGSSKSVSQPHGWNAILTLAALRDVYGPAPAIQHAVSPIYKMLTGGGEEHGRAFAALALGCFPWTEGEGAGDDPALKAVPGPTALRNLVDQTLKQGRLALGDRAASPTNIGVLARASLLALSKMGGPRAAELVCSIDANVTKSTIYQQALLLARAFSHADDAKPCFERLKRHHQREVTKAAALAIAVSCLVEDRPAWTNDRAKLNEELDLLRGRNKEEVAAGLFARGINALVNEAPDDDWRKMWEETTHAKVEDIVAEAGAQVMLFCPRRWFHDEIVKWASQPPTPPSDAVRSMLMLRAGELATSDSVEACIKLLRSSSATPKPREDWDARWYAAIGLLRALHAQRLTDPVLREQIVDAFERAERAILKPGPFKDALARLLKQYGKTLRGSSNLPVAALRAVEGSIPDRWGLLAADARDLCAHRVNQLVEEIFEFPSIEPSKVGVPQKTRQPERYLKRYLARYPYFSRLQFQKRRGTRPVRVVDDSLPEGLNR